MANKMRNAAKERRWREALKRFARSGLNVRAFCRRERVTEASFTYAQNQWTALNVYVTQGYLNIDNDAAERAMKRVAIGRKNWLFAGNDTAAASHARLWSLIASAERHGLDPQLSHQRPSQDRPDASQRTHPVPARRVEAGGRCYSESLIESLSQDSYSSKVRGPVAIFSLNLINRFSTSECSAAASKQLRWNAASLNCANR
jgi:hypothetical protein